MKQIDVLTGLWKRKLFKPFGVAMKDGSKIQVDHPEYLIVREGSAFFVDREGHFTIFDEDSVVRITSRRNGASRH